MDSINTFVGRHQGEKVKRTVLVQAQKVGNWIMSIFGLLHSDSQQGEGLPCTQSNPWLCLGCPVRCPQAFCCRKQLALHPVLTDKEKNLDCLSLNWQDELRLGRAAVCQSRFDAPAPAPQQENNDVQEKMGKLRSPAGPLRSSTGSIRLGHGALESVGATQTPAALFVVAFQAEPQ